MLLSIFLSLLSLSTAFETKNNIDSKRIKRSIELIKNLNYSNPVKFYISSEFKQTAIIKKALKHLHYYTCLNFKELKKEISKDGINFQLKGELDVINKNYIDKVSYVQLTEECSLNLGCMKHMMGRAFGLNLETSRYDRNKYIKIHWDKLKNKLLYKREKDNSTRIFNTAFDFGSIMMPDISFGSIDGRHAYEILESPYYISMVGQREEYSHNDLKKINDVYCGGRCAKKVKGCKNGGYPSPDCGVCKCPPGYIGKYCTEIAESFGNCGPNKLVATKNKRKLIFKGHVKCITAIYSKAGTNVAIVIDNLKSEEHLPCVEHTGLEIKYRHDKGTTGLCLCGNYKNITVPPTFSQVLIIFYGKQENHELKLTYQQVKRKKN